MLNMKLTRVLRKFKWIRKHVRKVKFFILFIFFNIFKMGNDSFSAVPSISKS